MPIDSKLEAKNFYLSIVVPTVDEFKNEPNNVRRGRLASIVLYHMADYWDQFSSPNPTDKTLKLLCTQLISKYPSFKLIRDVADASKHARLRTQTEIQRTISTTDQISRQPGLLEAPFGTGVFAEASVIVVTHDDGTVSELKPAIENVLAMWNAMVAQL